jgi:tRNA(Ile)-lysidine synthase
MVEPGRVRGLEDHLRESTRQSTQVLPASEQRVVAKVENQVARVVGPLVSHPRIRLLAAISGGPDSMASLYALQRIRGRLHFELAAAHLNHGIRGLESDRDERFVRELCDQLKIDLVVERAYGLRSANLEERARELRYEFLNRAADTLDAQFIVVGHHQDDQAETVLLRLLRGAGIAGLAAMAEFGPGRLVRPLLSLDRATILAYLQAIGAGYVLDSSNLESGVLRNRVRAALLPQIAREYSPGIARRLAELAAEMRELNSFIEAEGSRELDRRLLPQAVTCQASPCRMDLDEFGSLSPALARGVIRELIRRCVGDLRRIERVHIDSMWRLAVGDNTCAAVLLPRRWRFRREYDTAILERRLLGVRTSSGCETEVRLTPGANALTPSGAILTIRELTVQQPFFPTRPWHPPSRFEAYIDAASAPMLTSRCFRPGDRIRPLGLSGSKKIHDVFVDYKVSAESRRLWPLVMSGDDVIWIPGLVRSRIALVTPESKKVLHLRADSLPDHPKVRLPQL